MEENTSQKEERNMEEEEIKVEAEDKKTELENSHLQRVLSFYPFEIGEARLLSSRSGRTMWEVDTDQGAKILKQADMKPARMLFIAGAHEHLLSNGLPITPIHKTKNGGLCLGTEKQAYVLYDKVEGGEVIYYNLEQMKKVMNFAAQFHNASKGYIPSEESKKRGRLGKWHKLFRWKLQELEGNKAIAQSYPTDAFSMLFLEHVDKMLLKGRDALNALDERRYSAWSEEFSAAKGFCQQDFTLARFTDVEGNPFMKELHSITTDLPARDLRILLNKVMKKMSVWDSEMSVQLLAAYDASNPLTENQYRVLWTDLNFPHLFCSIAHKYYLGQKRSWSDEKYIWALQNIIAVENSKDEFIAHFPDIFRKIKLQSGGEANG